MSRPRLDFRPPARSGLNPSCVAMPLGGRWTTVLAFLCERLPRLSEAEWQARLQAGDVLDEAGATLGPLAPFRGGQRLWYWRDAGPEVAVPFEAQVLFQDEHLLVVDKPHFLPMTPKGRHVRETLLVRLQAMTGLDTLVPIHRLDRETAGVVAFSIRPQDRGAYQAMFRSRQVHKQYEAIAGWRADLPPVLERQSRLEPSERFMQMAEVAGEPNAHSLIERLEIQGQRAKYRLTPYSGQTHQLRVHMASLGLPLEGDRIYPVLQPELAEGQPPDWQAPLQLLARHLSFDCPFTGRRQSFFSRRSLNWNSSLDSSSLISF